MVITIALEVQTVLNPERSSHRAKRAVNTSVRQDAGASWHRSPPGQGVFTHARFPPRVRRVASIDWSRHRRRDRTGSARRGSQPTPPRRHQGPGRRVLPASERPSEVDRLEAGRRVRARSSRSSRRPRGRRTSTPTSRRTTRGSVAAGLVRGSYHFARPAKPIVSTAQGAGQVLRQGGRDRDQHRDAPAGARPRGHRRSELDAAGDLGADVPAGDAAPHRPHPDALHVPLLLGQRRQRPQAFKRFPLWMASYGSTAPTASLWQYTSTRPGEGHHRTSLDLSKYVGSSGPAWATSPTGRSRRPGRLPRLRRRTTSAAGGADKEATVSWRPGDAGTQPGDCTTSSPARRATTRSPSAAPAPAPRCLG